MRQNSLIPPGVALFLEAKTVAQRCDFTSWGTGCPEPATQPSTASMHLFILGFCIFLCPLGETWLSVNIC